MRHHLLREETKEAQTDGKKLSASPLNCKGVGKPEDSKCRAKGSKDSEMAVCSPMHRHLACSWLL